MRALLRLSLLVCVAVAIAAPPAAAGIDRNSNDDVAAAAAEGGLFKQRRAAHHHHHHQANKYANPQKEEARVPRGTRHILAGAPPIDGGSLELRKSFFQNLLNGFAHELERTVAGLDFPAVGNSDCASVLINAGKWFDTVAIPNSTAAVAGVTGSPTAIRLSAPGVSIRGLGGSKSWSSLQSSSVAGAWTTCFQLCFGASPFDITTGLETKPRFNIKRGAVTTVSVDDAALGYSAGWTLNPVTGMCVSDQKTFDAVFNQGMSPTIASAVPTMSKVVGDAFNSILANSTATGFDGLYVDAATGLVTLSNGPPPPTIHIPMPGGKPGGASSVKATVTLDASILTGMETATCVQQAPCGEPVGQGTTKMQYTECGACLQAVNGSVYFAFESDAGFAQPATLRRSIQQPKKAAPGGTIKMARRNHQPRRVAARAEPTTPATPAIESRTFNTLSLMSKALTTAGAEAASLLQSVTVTPADNTPLPGAEDYCHVSHGGFTWGIPNELAINAIATNATTAPGAATSVTVEIPGLSSIGGSGHFSTWCLVGLPLGTPFRDAAAGNFKVSMAPPSGSFQVTVSVQPDGTVTVTDYPELAFEASVEYANEQRAFSFSPYLSDLFVTSVKNDAVAATKAMLRDQITALWVGKLSGLFKTSAGAVLVGGAATSMGAAVTLSTASVQPSENEITLDALVPAAAMGSYAATANGGMLLTVAPAAPFSVDNCAQRAVCSNAASSAAPLSEPLTLVNCTSCVTTVQGQLVLGSKFGVSFAPAANQQQQVLRAATTNTAGAAAAAKPVIRLQKRQFRARAPAPTPDFDSVFYAGKAILSQATAIAGPVVRQAFAGYSHAPQADLGLLYVQQFCNVSHPAVSWSGVPAAITPTVSAIAPGEEAGVVTMTIDLQGLPTALESASVNFNTACAIGNELPTAFREQQAGTAAVRLAFATNDTVQLTLRVAVMTNPESGPLVDAVVLSMTPFALTGTYSYGGDGGFTLDAYVKNYFESQLPSLMTAEVQQVMQEQVWFAIDRTLGDLITDTMLVSPGCNVSSFSGTHLVVSRGAACGAAIPGPASALSPSEFLYLVDAGPTPAGILSNHSSAQQLSSCTAALALGSPLSSTVQLTNCSTSSSVIGGRVLLTASGAEPLTQ